MTFGELIDAVERFGAEYGCRWDAASRRSFDAVEVYVAYLREGGFKSWRLTAQELAAMTPRDVARKLKELAGPSKYLAPGV